MIHRHLAALLVSLLVLAGCATVSAIPPRPAPNEITVFAFTGRLAVRQGETRHHLKIDWRHARAGDEILLASPLGQGVAEIVRDTAGARLTLADKRVFTAEDWGTLAAQVFGFRLPLDASARWLLGDTRDADGWTMRVLERESDRPDALPTIIEFERDDIAGRLRIDAWSEVR